jgi:hypothetical protein
MKHLMLVALDCASTADGQMRESQKTPAGGQKRWSFHLDALGAQQAEKM